MENLDTDVPPPPEVIEVTRAAIGPWEFNSWLPFSGRYDMKEAVADHIEARSSVRYDPYSEIAITTSDGTGMLDSLLATTDPGDEGDSISTAFALPFPIRPRLCFCRTQPFQPEWFLTSHLLALDGEHPFRRTPSDSSHLV
jgi:hypothetical protein